VSDLPARAEEVGPEPGREGDVKMITLAGGEQVPELTYRAVMLNIARLSPVELYEASELAHNPEHEIWSKQVKKNLQAASIINQDGVMHDAVRAIILDLG
jgi:hypothetical protein